MSTVEPAALDDEAVAAIRRHMNADHNADNLAIVRRHGAPADGRPNGLEAGDIVSAEVVTLDGAGITFATSTLDGRRHHWVVRWSGPITERADVRRELVRLTEAALGADPAASPSTQHPRPGGTHHV